MLTSYIFVVRSCLYLKRDSSLVCLCCFVSELFSFSLLTCRPRAHSGGAAEEGGKRRQRVLVFRPQRGQEIGESGSQREAEVCRDSPGGPGTPGEVSVQ